MQSDKVTVTLYACSTSEGLAKACHENTEHWWARCPVGMHFDCPLATLGDGRCAKIEAKDWEAVMTVKAGSKEDTDDES